MLSPPSLSSESSHSGAGGGGGPSTTTTTTTTNVDDSRKSSISAMDEDEFYPLTLQQELNEILEAFYSAISEEDIIKYQQFVNSISESKIAENALKEGDVAPNFELEDQDGDKIQLSHLLLDGPVVLVFYRGKWCPHCNATIMRLQRELESIKSKGATLVAISPMLPDGTHYLATKRCLEFSVCSDVGNTVAKSYNITFEVRPEFRDSFLKWGEDIPQHNGNESPWDIPLPSTYIVNQDGRIVWSFIDNDPGIRAEVSDIVSAIPTNYRNQIINNNNGNKQTKMSDTSKCHNMNNCAKNNNTSETFTSRTLIPEDVSEDFHHNNHSAELIGGGGGGHCHYRQRRQQHQRHQKQQKQQVNPNQKNQRALSVTFRKSIKKVFGKRRQSAPEFLGNYLG